MCIMSRQRTRRDIIRTAGTTTAGLAVVSGSAVASKNTAQSESVHPTSTKSFSITFEVDSSGETGGYRVKVPDGDATCETVDTGFLGNDTVKRYDSKTIVQGKVKPDKEDEIKFDTDDGERPPGDDWWSADPGVDVTLDTPSGSETLQ
ncbi:hypothetical protein KVP04_00870 [Halobacterium salinarum]|nr:hypothetical protein [Halobacterium salinarum]MCF2168964.1 hypothetical protein [Halobacterium salinarum]MCF2237688.1 hypothetical protein [Halobacterium salinarum]